LFSENSNFLIQNIAFDAFLHNRLVASVNEPEGLNNIPRYLYSVQYSKALLLKINLSFFYFPARLVKNHTFAFVEVNSEVPTITVQTKLI
jgi:hypothetical protein